MQITFTPQRRDDTLTLSKTGDVLTIGGEDFDFSQLAEGDLLPREAVTSDWLASDVERIGGVVHLSIVVPHGAKAPITTLFPAPVTATDGAIPVPAHSEVSE
jgi:hypothetical protein